MGTLSWSLTFHTRERSKLRPYSGGWRLKTNSCLLRTAFLRAIFLSSWEHQSPPLPSMCSLELLIDTDTHRSDAFSRHDYIDTRFHAQATYGLFLWVACIMGPLPPEVPLKKGFAATVTTIFQAPPLPSPYEMSSVVLLPGSPNSLILYSWQGIDWKVRSTT